MNNSVECHKCKQPTIPHYKIGHNKYLCLSCAENHVDTMIYNINARIENLQQTLINEKNKLQEFRYASCNHSETEIKKTGYCIKNDSNMQEICICTKCGKTIYKDI